MNTELSNFKKNLNEMKIWFLGFPEKRTWALTRDFVEGF